MRIMEITKREIKTLEERTFPSEICFKPIGIMHSPFKSLKGVPIQPSVSEDKGLIEIFPQYKLALKDLDKFGFIICIFHFDMVKLPIPLQSKPFLDDEEHGVFAIRTPFRPNPIGFSILKLTQIIEHELHVENVDILDNTPILDIKPYVPHFDVRETEKIGWLQGKIKKKLS